ncbi:MAG TPA: ammonium transporter [Hypericibacter adhaerens]|uniref:ammonium transporter n=1 Tax=Hypericibacter adhaerens TaxID=2602016 RepID=UPI002BDA7589|nr:ammonium transporter [Hypericibacter adhaerens]HWA44712.1 ammonium transporter [Hypericibacter adhaerens]
MKVGAWALAALVLVVPQARAQDGAIDSGNTAWMLVSTALVILMTVPGLVLFYGGLVRKKNVLATFVQCFATCALVSVVWMIAGYSLAFSPGNAFIGGFGALFLGGMEIGSTVGTIPESVFMTFQMAFAVIAPALITGAYADRMKFSAMLVFNAAWVLLVYTPVCHWVWGGGFLGSEGVLDYAGGTVVHINAGVTGLVAALVIGKRLRYGSEHFPPHSLAFSVVGAALLWFGWFGFNAGSALAADGRAGMALAVTQIAAAGATLSWMAVEWILRGKPSGLGLISGAVGGLVAITPAAGFVGPASGLAIGLIAGVACYWGANALKRQFNYDDSLDAFGIHGVGGIVGALLTGVFASASIGGVPGLIEGNAGQVLTQLWGTLATIAYCAAVTWIILFAIRKTIGLRVDEKTETVGLDIALHGQRAYEM